MYLVTDRQQTAGRDLVSVVGQALQAGLAAVQLREKDLDGRDLFRLAERVQAVTRQAGAALLINDRVDVAMALDADGVHLTRRSLPPQEARGLLGAGKLIGISCHSVAEVKEAAGAGVDFLVVGPVYATPSKAQYGAPLSPDILRQARAVCDLPILAIGGIKTAQVPSVLSAGADGVAVVSAIVAAPDPGAATRELLSAVARARGA